VHFEIMATDARPIYVQIMDEIRRAIVLGTVHENEALPSVRQLAADLRINPNTVQQAYRELEREGVVEVRRGQGTYVLAGGDRDAERGALLEAVTGRALRDAYRHGFTGAELVESLRRAAAAENGAIGGGDQ
jgi:GntR family transcriptional regulator